MIKLIDILFVIPILIFSVTITMPLLNPVKKYFGGLKNWKFISILSFISIVMSISLYCVSQILINKNKEVISEKYNKEMQIDDSINKIQFDQKKALNEKNKQIDLIKYIQSYYDAYCINNTKKLDSYYSLPLKRYYTLINVNQESVHERSNFEYLSRGKKPFKNECKISKEKITINKVSKDTIEVSIEQANKKEGRVYTKIMLNKENKIFSIMNVIQKQYEDSTDIKFDLITKKLKK